MNLSVVFYCLLYAALNVTGATIIKTELPNHQLSNMTSYIKLLGAWQVLVGFAFILFSAMIMFKSLSLGRFSYVLPIATGINFLLTVLVGVYIFSDKLTFVNYFGLLLILIGIIFSSFK